MMSEAISIKRRFDLVQVENGWLVRENNHFQMQINSGLPTDRMWIVRRPEDIPAIINEAVASDGRT